MRGFLLLGLIACGGGDPTLRVDLRTDYVPEREVVEVRTQVWRDVALEDLIAAETRPVPTNGPAFDGFRAAETRVPQGLQRVTVELLDASGLPIARRLVVIDVRDDVGVTVIVTRDCAGVSCPNEDAAATECLGGRCVSPECTPETPESCPEPECTDASGCSVEVSCAEAVCLEGTCAQRFSDDRCGAGEVCDPSLGCTPLANDAGADAAVDAGFDASVDAASDAALDASSSACTSTCPGTCVDDTCVITNPAGDVVCPTGIDCEIVCDASAACTGTITCNASSRRCEIQCIGDGSCTSVECRAERCDVTCSGTGTCGSVTTDNVDRASIDCFGAGSCATVDCTTGRCDIECAPTACAGGVSCVGSCACGVSCSGCAPVCPPACRDGMLCDRDLLGCDTCD